MIATIDNKPYQAGSSLALVGRLIGALGDSFTMAPAEPAGWPDFLADMARQHARLPVWRAPVDLTPEQRAAHVLESLHNAGAIALDKEAP